MQSPFNDNPADFSLVVGPTGKGRPKKPPSSRRNKRNTSVPIEFVGGRSFLYLGSNGAAVPANAGLTGGTNTGAQAGDYIVVALGASNNGSIPPELAVSGFTSLGTAGQLGPLSSLYCTRLQIMGRVATGSDSIIIPANANWGGAGGSILVFRNVDTSSPLDSGPVFSINTTTAEPISVATTVAASGSAIASFAVNPDFVNDNIGLAPSTGAVTAWYASSLNNGTEDFSIGGGYGLDKAPGSVSEDWNSTGVPNSNRTAISSILSLKQAQI